MDWICLWKRLEDAKLQLDHCHNYVREIIQDKAHGALAPKEENLAYRHALKAEELAVKTYFRTLNDFKAALPPPSNFRLLTQETGMLLALHHESARCSR